MVMVTKELESLAGSINKHGMSTYLTIFVCAAFIFSNYMLLSRIDSMLARVDLLLDRQNVIAEMNTRLYEVHSKTLDTNKKVEYLLMKANNDEELFKRMNKGSSVTQQEW